MIEFAAMGSTRSRNALAEGIGTFALVFVGTGAIVVASTQ